MPTGIDMISFIILCVHESDSIKEQEILETIRIQKLEADTAEIEHDFIIMIVGENEESGGATATAAKAIIRKCEVIFKMISQVVL